MAAVGLKAPKNLSPELQAIVGAGPMSRLDVIKALWDYIKANNLKNPANKREILTDDKLKKIFDGKDSVGMLEMGKYLSPHLS